MSNTITKTFQDDTELHLIADQLHEFLLTSKEVALGYGVNSATIRRHKQNQSDELIKGKHWVVQNMNTLGGTQKQTLWTKRGLVRLGFFIKSARAKKFRDWCEDLILKESTGHHDTTIPFNDKDQIAFHEKYHCFNPNAEFFIEHSKTRAKAFMCSRHGFLISSVELSRLLCVTASTIGVLKHYHLSKLTEGVHYVNIGTNSSYWTREGAGWMALHSGDGSFGTALLNGQFREVELNNQILLLNSYDMISRAKELDPTIQEEA